VAGTQQNPDKEVHAMAQSVVSDDRADSTMPESAAVKKLSLKERLSYGAGDIGSNLSWNLVGSFLLFYYTDVAHLPAATLGTVFLVARILDAVIDPFFGLAVDKTRSRFGKARPWIIFGTIPFGILGVLVFTVPDISEGGKLAYAFATFFLLGILFSAVNVPYSALMPMMTANTNERMNLGSLRSIGSSVGTILVTAATTPLVIALGGSQTSHKGWMLIAIIFGALSVSFLLVTAVNCKERYAVDAHEDQTPVREVLKNMMRNRALIVTFVFGVANFIRLGFVLAITVYFCLVSLQAPWAISIMLPSVSGSMIVGGLIAPAYYKRLGKRNGNVIALGSGALVWSCQFFLVHDPVLLISTFFIANVCIGTSMTSMFTMVADSVDYQQWKFGQRNEGLLSAGVSFATKLGMALGGAAVAYALGWMGYNPQAPSESVSLGIQNLFLIVPLVLIIIQLITMCFWNLDKDYNRIVEEIEARGRQTKPLT
jgi:sugar (glycoside-pentoside-hexuronide) transporter